MEWETIPPTQVIAIWDCDVRPQPTTGEWKVICSTNSLAPVRCRRSLELVIFKRISRADTVYPKKYAHGFCFAVLCCGYTLTDFPISIRLTSLALWQSNDCPSASKATLMNMDKYFMWIQYERLHNHNKAKHNKTVCIFLGIYCILAVSCGITLSWIPKHLTDSRQRFR